MAQFLSSSKMYRAPRASRLSDSSEVILRPVQSVAGALSAYAGGKESFAEIRSKVWQEVYCEIRTSIGRYKLEKATI